MLQIKINIDGLSFFSTLFILHLPIFQKMDFFRKRILYTNHIVLYIYCK